MADLRDLRLRVTATVHNTIDETLAHLEKLEVFTSGLMSRNEALSRMVDGRAEEFTQLIVHECLHNAGERRAPEVIYEDLPDEEDIHLKLYMRWRLARSHLGTNGEKCFTISVVRCKPPCNHADSTNFYRNAQHFEVSAGNPRYYSHADRVSGWSLHLKMEAFHDQ